MKIAWPKKNRRLGWPDAVGLLGLVGLAMARFVPVARLPFWGCPLRRATGWPCLGCGLTRAADFFAHGHMASAFAVNPLGALGACAFALAAVMTLLHWVFAIAWPRVSLTPREIQIARIGLIAAVVANYSYVVVHTKFPGLLG